MIDLLQEEHDIYVVVLVLKVLDMHAVLLVGLILIYTLKNLKGWEMLNSVDWCIKDKNNWYFLQDNASCHKSDTQQ